MRDRSSDTEAGDPLSLQVRVGPFLVHVGTDDIRVVRAIRELALDDSALEDRGGGDAVVGASGGGGGNAAPEIRCVVTLTTGGCPPRGRLPGQLPGRLPPREDAVATFEDVELHASPAAYTLIVGRESVVVIDRQRKRADGHIAPAHVLRPWIVAHRIFSLTIIELLRCFDAYYLHAGCVSDGGKGILICGASGDGKSTLTYALARAGFSFLSDDGVFLRRTPSGIEAFSWPEKIKLDRRSCSFFEELRPWAESRTKTEIPLKSTRITSVSRRSRPAALIVPVRGAGPSSEIRPIPRHDALARFLGQTIPLLEPEGMDRQLDLLAELVMSCRCLELEAGTDFDRIPSLVRDASYSSGGTFR